MNMVELADSARSGVSYDGTESKYASGEMAHSLSDQLFCLMFGLLVCIEVTALMTDWGFDKVPCGLPNYVNGAQVGEFF